LEGRSSGIRSPLEVVEALELAEQVVEVCFLIRTRAASPEGLAPYSTLTI
jgi:hypothetical protein